MQISISHVTKADSRDHRRVGLTHQSVGLEALAGVEHEVVELGEGDRDVVAVDTAKVFGGLWDAFAPGPEVLELGLVHGEGAVGADFFLHHALEEGLELGIVVFLVGAAGLDEDVEGVLVLERSLLAGCLGYEVLCGAVHHLECREDLPELGLGLDECLEDMFVAWETKVGYIDGAAPLGTDNADCCDDTNRALASNKQLLEIKARVVLPQLAQVVENCSVWKHGFNAEDGAVEGAVAEETETTGVAGDVAANVAGAFGAEVEREDVALLGEEFVGGLEDHAGVGDEDTGGGVEGADLVHGVEGEDDFVKDGDAATWEDVSIEAREMYEIDAYQPIRCFHPVGQRRACGHCST